MAVVDLVGAVRGSVVLTGLLEGGTGLSGTVAATAEVSAGLDVIPAPRLPPISEQPWYRTSEVYPDPTTMLLAYDRPDPDTFVPTATIQTLGYPLVRVGGEDLTYWRNVPVRLRSWADSEPFGCGYAHLSWPHGTLLTDENETVVRKGQSLDIGMVNPDGSFRQWLWRGLVVEVVRTENEVTVTAIGVLRQGLYAMHQPPFFPSLVDSGHEIAKVLNSVVSRRYPPVQAVTTGIETAKRGARSDTVMGYVLGLLSMMTTDDGLNQWTVMPNHAENPALRLKDRTTEHWSVTAGSRGVTIRLTDDLVEDPNVIYGSGISDKREKWDNARWPGSSTNLAPAYPNTNPANTITQGETDADTDNGKGVTQIQSRLTVLGFRVTADGSYGSATTQAVRNFQRSAGIQVDGVVAGQTWNALWPIKGALGTPLFLPLAAREHVMPVVYNADGSIKAPNPTYDPTALRVERYYNFGEGVSRNRAQDWAVSMMRRNELTPNIVGSIRLESDPEEDSRLFIRAGQNIRVKGYAGTTAGVLLHIVALTVDGTDGSVILQVDARARDALELRDIVDRNSQAVDPAHRILSDRESLNDKDLSPWHSEAPAGFIPTTAVFSHLWSIMAIPLGAWGKVVRTLMVTSPAAAYAAIVFSRPVTSQWLLNVVGNPLAEGSNGFGKIANQEKVLAANGMLVGWGQSGQAMGYFPGQTSASGGSGTLTGEFDEQSAWEFASYAEGYVFLAVYADRSTFLTGRLYVDLPYDG